ncbi:sulfatase [Joostella sp.]|uniref:sulfatase family protein n=1 Tax=Joostella sp. TaxID=2231138 RepID=UPI003A940D6A
MKLYKLSRILGVGIYLFLLPIIAAQDRPNILWITFEDTSPQFIGCYGNKDAETPVMDKIASQGVRFTSAFSTGTVCSASRSAIITGVPTYKLGTGNHRSNYAIPDFIKGFPLYLKQNGYYVSNNKKTDYNVENIEEFTAETWDESSKNAGWWNRKGKQPFFSVFNVEDSHQSRTMSMTYHWYEKNVLAYLPNEKNEVKQTQIANEIYDYKNQNITSLATSQLDYAGLHEKHWIADTAFEVPPIYRDSPEMRKQLARVYNSLKLTDNKMGRLIQRLENEGLLENTIVFIFADHGEGIPRAKTNGIGLGYRVPFIVRFPDKYKYLSPWDRGTVTDELIDFEDLAPTILSLTGIKIPKHLKGRPFLGEKRQLPSEFKYLSSDRADNGIDMVRTITDGRFVYSRNFMPFFPELKYLRYVEIGEITQQMRLDHQNGKLNKVQNEMFKARHVEVLYDLKNDSWETKNLINKEEFNGIALKMRKELKKQVLLERDIHFAPEYELVNISKEGTPYEYRLDEKKFPLDEIYDTANLVGKGEIKDQMFKKLESKNKFVRYWASVGLFSVKEYLSVSELNKVKDKLNDDYAPVEINLAATLYAENRDKEAENRLNKFIVDPRPNLALEAINYTLYFNNRDAFTTSIEAVYLQDCDYKVKAACLDFMDLEGLISDFKQN